MMKEKGQAQTVETKPVEEIDPTQEVFEVGDVVFLKGHSVPMTVFQLEEPGYKGLKKDFEEGIYPPKDYIKCMWFVTGNYLQNQIFAKKSLTKKPMPIQMGGAMMESLPKKTALAQREPYDVKPELAMQGVRTVKQPDGSVKIEGMTPPPAKQEPVVTKKKLSDEPMNFPSESMISE